MTQAAMVSYTPITEFMKMPFRRFYDMYAAIARVMERRNKE